MKIHTRFAAGAALSLLLTACSGSPSPTMGEPSAASQAAVSGQALDQLQKSKANLEASGLPIHLLEFHAAGPLATDAEVQALEGRMIEDAAMVPQYDGAHAATFSVRAIGDRMRDVQAGQPEAQDVVANIRGMAFPAIHPGQKTADLTWESQGRVFHTTCVYDEKGVVYDNLLSNLVFVEAQELPAETSLDQLRRSAAESATPMVNQSFTATVVDLTLKWVWGSTRGKVHIDHYVITSDGWYSFSDDGGSATAYMDLGSAGAQQKRHSLTYPRISKQAWGYGWATPTASFHIAWQSGSASFDVSLSGVGSDGKGEGIHTIY